MGIRGFFQGVAGLSRKVSGAVEQLNEYISIQKEVQEAVSQLSVDTHAERTLINAAVSSAKKSREVEIYLEKAGEQRQRAYLETHERLRQLLNEDPEGVDPDPFHYSTPEFYLPIETCRPEVADAVEARIIEFKNERAQFLKNIVSELADDGLRPHFHQALEQMVSASDAAQIYGMLFVVSRPPSRTELVFASPIRPSRTASELATPSHSVDRLNHRTFPTGTDTVRRIAELIKLPFLVHFTRTANLDLIMRRGLSPVAAFDEQKEICQANDRLRLDGHRDANCLSIAHPNDKMFYKYRMQDPDESWVVLVLNPSILWTMNSAFCRHNAADRRISSTSVANLKTASAFLAMFRASDDEEGRADWLRPFDPSDVQAEVLVFDVVPPTFIEGLVFSDARGAQDHAASLGQRHISVGAKGRGFFGARSYVRQTGWNF